MLYGESMRWFTLLLLGCGDQIEVKLEDQEIEEAHFDNDLDGFLADEDCNDGDASIFPDAEELCDGIDNDCDNAIDEDVTATFYADGDGDGFGNNNISIESCTASEGFVTNGSDCDDGDPNTYPSAEELCDERDNNCNNNIDEGLGENYYLDSDGDGFGDPSQSLLSCSTPQGYSNLNTDCDDNNSQTNPNSAEMCDGIDNNCNGETDEDPAIDGALWYEDFDGDGFGNPMFSITACSQPEGFTVNNLDCNDIESHSYPGADELCNGLDDDCDGSIDEDGAIDAPIWYLDSDEDDFGSLSSTLQSCDQPEHHVANSGDCDDNDNDIHPQAPELCNNEDDNCDDLVDNEPTDGVVWFVDYDEDGFGDPNNTTIACLQPDNLISDSGDCDDENSTINPDAIELCNEQDDNCDTFTDEGNDDGDLWYHDGDEDGYGDPLLILQACTQPENYVANAEDCNDNNEDISPDAIEFCNDRDDNCDTQIDEASASDALSLYFDFDEDGFGSVDDIIRSCSFVEGYVDNADDCEDNTPLISPDADEICDDIDNNCDDLIDDSSAIDALLWYQDLDEDGFGNTDVFEMSCEQPDYFSLTPLDCDDQDNTINPDADELWYDGIDQDCDELSDFDQDGDGFIAEAHGGDDCNDTDSELAEYCDFGLGNEGSVDLNSGSSIVINSYTPLTSNADSGEQNIALGDSDLFAVGDEILIIQMQGPATAGTYEFNHVQNSENDTLTLLKPLTESYVASDGVQIVRVPNYEDLTITGGTTVTALEWDGSTGGIVAFRVAGIADISGSVNVNEQGYRGGQQNSYTSHWNGYTGESLVASFQNGGNSNSYGGGGSSYCACGEAAGAGGYATTGGNVSGGSCSGQAHGEAGGTYGIADLSDLFYGSGGGGGCADDGCEAPAGKDGGGIVFIAAAELTLSGSIQANGGDAPPNGGNCDDTIGGAGAGGSIFIMTQTATINTNSISAQGGASTYITQSGVTTGVGGDGRIRFDFSTLNGYEFGNSSANDTLNNACTPDAGHSESF
ncbi:MAG: hypothetical protein CMK59_10595 [Proteobacteria bacterium]|nr:hypothetical protein [Pseudomonadota bacterium]